MRVIKDNVGLFSPTPRSSCFTTNKQSLKSLRAARRAGRSASLRLYAAAETKEGALDKKSITRPAIRDGSSGEVSGTAAESNLSPAGENATGNFVPVMKPEELPKGDRKVVRVDGVDVLLFWYRNQIYCIEARSPAEGAYSEGFQNARLNQDFCIACPSTGTLFSLKTGEIVDWYPNNPVLKVLTPQSTCRNLDIFPVKLTQEAISVDVSGVSDTAFVPQGKGGADSSIDLNNVFAEENRPYYEGQNPESDFFYPSPPSGEINQSEFNQTNPYVIAVSLFAIVFAGIAGSAFAIYKESYIGLGILWAGLLVLAAYSIVNYTPLGNSDQKD